MLVPSSSPHAPSGNARLNALTRSDEVGLQPAIAGWTTTRKETHAVSVRPVSVSRADCDYAVGIAGISYAESGVTFVRTVLGLESLVTEIARGRDYHHATLDQSLTFVADRRAATGEIADVVWNRKTEVRAVNAQVSVALV